MKRCRGVTFVRENAPEIIDLKKGLYQKFEVLSLPEALIASSASSLVWSTLNADMRAPHRLLTAHPFNPPHLISLVEMYCPSKDTLDFAEKFIQVSAASQYVLNVK